MGEYVLPWRIEMLGRLRARQGDVVVSKFQTQKTGALLAYLALELGRTVPRDRLGSAIWSDGDPAALRNRVTQAVSSLRRQLEAPASGFGRIFLSDHHTLGLDPASVLTDVAEFERLMESAQGTAPGEDRTRLLERAVQLYRGELLEGLNEPWVAMRRHQLATVVREALTQVTRAYAEQGRFAVAADYASRLVALEPTVEESHLELMTLLSAAGRPAAALRQFELLRTTLAARGRTPSQLAEDLRNRLASEPTSPVAVDLARQAPLQSSAQAVVSLPVRRSNVPTPFHRLVDREEEREALQRLLLEQGSRFVTLVGIGGSGKSRLAVEVALGLREQFHDNVFLVPLATQDRQEKLMERVCASVSPETPSDRRTYSTVKAVLEQEQAVLLVLDSAEHVSPADLQQLARMSDELPQVRLLCTSRQALHLPGETQFPLGPLPVPQDPKAPVRALARNASVMLFVQRAQAVKPDFQITERTSEAVAKLCARLEGLPLALELAAGWARSLTPAQMLEKLGERLNFLESRRRDIGQRHRTLRAVLDSTVSLLPTDLREAFFRMSVFVGGFDHDSAARVCPDCEIEVTLDRLVEACVIQEAEDSLEPARFRMLETLQDYAREQASADLLEEAGWLHAQYFLDLVEASAAVPRATPRPVWLKSVSLEHPNILAALDWLLQRGRASEAARIACSLVDFWELTVALGEGCERLQAVLRSLPKTNLLCGRCLAGLARLEWHRGNQAEAAELASRALEVARSADDPRAVTDALLTRQILLHVQGRLEESLSLAEEALATARTAGDTVAQSRAELRIGNIRMDQGRLEDARISYEASLDLGRQASDPARVASALVNIGACAFVSGQLDLGRVALTEGLEIAQDNGLRASQAVACVSLARVEAAAGSLKRALAWLSEAIQCQFELPAITIDVLLAGAEIAIGSHEFGLAARLLGTVEARFGQPLPGPDARGRFARLSQRAEDELGTARFDEQKAIGSHQSVEDAQHSILSLSARRATAS